MQDKRVGFPFRDSYGLVLRVELVSITRAAGSNVQHHLCLLQGVRNAEQLLFQRQFAQHGVETESAEANLYNPETAVGIL